MHPALFYLHNTPPYQAILFFKYSKDLPKASNAISDRDIWSGKLSIAFKIIQ